MACLRDLRNVTFAEKLNTAKMELIHLDLSCDLTIIVISFRSFCCCLIRFDLSS